MTYLDAFLDGLGLPVWRPKKDCGSLGGMPAKPTQPPNSGERRSFVGFAGELRGDAQVFKGVMAEVPSVSRPSTGGGAEGGSASQGRVELWRYEDAEWDRDRREDFEERAAIMEFDCGLPRAEAERRAFLIVGNPHTPDGA